MKYTRSKVFAYMWDMLICFSLEKTFRINLNKKGRAVGGRLEERMATIVSTTCSCYVPKALPPTPARMNGFHRARNSVADDQVPATEGEAICQNPHFQLGAQTNNLFSSKISSCKLPVVCSSGTHYIDLPCRQRSLST